MEPRLERPDQIYLLGSLVRGDWDSFPDTDLIWVAANKWLAKSIDGFFIKTCFII